MTRFVELPIVSDRGSTIWVNPDHVVAVEASVGEGKSFLLTEMGHRPHIALSQEAVVDVLGPPPEPYDSEIDLTEQIVARARENLQR